MNFNSYHNLGKYTCKTCDLVFKRKIDLYSHNSKKHAIADDAKIACEICGKLVARGKLYKRHVRMIHRETEIKVEPKRRSTKSVKAIAPRVTCRYCPKVLSNRKIKIHVSHNENRHGTYLMNFLSSPGKGS